MLTGVHGKNGLTASLAQKFSDGKWKASSCCLACVPKHLVICEAWAPFRTKDQKSKCHIFQKRHCTTTEWYARLTGSNIPLEKDVSFLCNRLPHIYLLRFFVTSSCAYTGFTTPPAPPPPAPPPATSPYYNQKPYTTTRRSVLQPEAGFRKTTNPPYHNQLLTSRTAGFSESDLYSEGRIFD